jgi:hypothetical protein
VSAPSRRNCRSSAVDTDADGTVETTAHDPDGF